MASADLERIAETYGIRLILQFGSTVTGRQHPRSDVDIAVLTDGRGLALEQRAELHHALQELFPDRELDLAILDHADPLFLKKVMDDCQLLYGAQAELQRLKLYAFKRYQDHRRYLDLERRFVEKALGSAARG
jgi:predicted nucleotidyltransferase